MDEQFLTYELKGSYLHFRVTSGRLGDKTGIDKILETAIEHRITKVLVDVRGWKAKPSTIDRYEFGQYLAQRVGEIRKSTGLSDWCLAFLGTEKMTEPKLAETVAINRGALMKTTTSLDEALAWLGVDTEDE